LYIFVCLKPIKQLISSKTSQVHNGFYLSLWSPYYYSVLKNILKILFLTHVTMTVISIR